MPFQPVPDCAMFTMVGRANSAAVEINNMIYAVPIVGGWSVGNLTSTATLIGDIWETDVVTHMASTYVFDRVEFRDLSEEFGTSGTVEYNTSGGDATLPLSALDCIYVSLLGDGGSPPRRGALFLSPFNEGDLAVDAWTNATKIDGIQAALDQIKADLFSASINQVIVSRYSKDLRTETNPKGLREEGIPNRVAQIIVQSNLATQRDRRTGKGI